MEHLLTPTASGVVTLGDLIDECDFDPLDKLLEKHAGDNCITFEFWDDRGKGYGKDGQHRRIIYRATVLVANGKRDWDDDSGWVAGTDTHRETVTVDALDSTDIDLIARLLAAEIRGIEGNIHA